MLGRVDTVLRQLLTALGEPLVDVVIAPAGLEIPVTGLSIVDPEDQPDQLAGQLVLVIGARGRDAVRVVRAVGRAGAAAVAVKAAGPVGELRSAAAEADVALLAVRPAMRWERLESLARDVLDAGTGSDEDGPGDLFSLAQTVALLTRGIVVIEDTASRVLAYSRSDSDAAQVDELRRLSILGWQGPADYLRLLREWGVFDRLRAGEEVVHIDERPELGIRPGWPSASTPGSAGWAPSGCRRAPNRSPSGPRTCCSVRPGWRPGISSGGAASRPPAPVGPGSWWSDCSTGAPMPTWWPARSAWTSTRPPLVVAFAGAGRATGPPRSCPWPS